NNMVMPMKTLRLVAVAALCGALVASGAETSAADDRETALWILRKGGRVLMEGTAGYIGDPFDLPEGPVRIAGADMHGTLVDGKQMEPLGKLAGLREVFI